MISLSCSLERTEGFFCVSIRDKTFEEKFPQIFFAGKDSLSVPEGISVFLPKIHN